MAKGKTATKTAPKERKAVKAAKTTEAKTTKAAKIPSDAVKAAKSNKTGWKRKRVSVREVLLWHNMLQNGEDPVKETANFISSAESAKNKPSEIFRQASTANQKQYQNIVAFMYKLLLNDATKKQDRAKRQLQREVTAAGVADATQAAELKASVKAAEAEEQAEEKLVMKRSLATLENLKVPSGLGDDAPHFSKLLELALPVAQQLRKYTDKKSPGYVNLKHQQKDVVLKEVAELRKQVDDLDAFSHKQMSVVNHQDLYHTWHFCVWMPIHQAVEGLDAACVTLSNRERKETSEPGSGNQLFRVKPQFIEFLKRTSKVDEKGQYPPLVAKAIETGICKRYVITQQITVYARAKGLYARGFFRTVEDPTKLQKRNVIFMDKDLQSLTDGPEQLSQLVEDCAARRDLEAEAKFNNITRAADETLRKIREQQEKIKKDKAGKRKGGRPAANGTRAPVKAPISAAPVSGQAGPPVALPSLWRSQVVEELPKDFQLS